jgi:hypothetical protein
MFEQVHFITHLDPAGMSVFSEKKGRKHTEMLPISLRPSLLRPRFEVELHHWRS